MSLGEFELIHRCFQRATPKGVVAVGIGDDCAVLQPTPGCQWLVSTDMLVEGRHFLSTVEPDRLGHKALAVNLSDLAACGATPKAFFLALALPRADAAWCDAFAQGLFALADAHGIVLAGGDTTAGPLNVSVTVMGEVPTGQALLRSGARVGDEVWVSGSLGDARLALEVFRGRLALPGEAFAQVRRAMECPQPRVALGLALRRLATSAIDVSDGFLGDLGHVLKSSNVGATIRADALPRSALLAAQSTGVQRLCTLTGGDDYELVFTAPSQDHAAVVALGQSLGVRLTAVGQIDPEPGLRLTDAQGRLFDSGLQSFDHFKSP
ncbi:thiamine-phosphate kinase [Inhella gelatinilytica]|uniref:Thiamine-monophosphate kinase n=1 Tax=Inhella gelatinilytica TaxID=2795030 RepID=A0A931ITB2_9BURK|nr:thiamine-phosphate kinase [Inhella gelatinilytica]MBH9551739.1 thiamine-phosphate kinase [Inhella gelatinilytica]